MGTNNFSDDVYGRARVQDSDELTKYLQFKPSMFLDCPIGYSDNDIKKKVSMEDKKNLSEKVPLYPCYGNMMIYVN